jgi:hypothetical protein
MKQSKKLLEQALGILPQDFSLREVRLHIARAIAELTRLEARSAKKEKQPTPLQKWQLNLETGKLVAPVLAPQQQIDILTKIDGLIKTEEQKIKDLKNKALDQKDMLLG